jgi:hypothetical protein
MTRFSLIAILLFAAIQARTARAEPVPPARLESGGTDILRALFFHHQFQPVSRGLFFPNDCVMVVYGELPPSSQTRFYLDIYNHVLRGGSLLLATNSATDLRHMLPGLEDVWTIDGRAVKEFAFRPGQDEDSPRMRFNETPPILQPDLVVMTQFNRVQTYKPTFQRPSASAAVIARFSSRATIGDTDLPPGPLMTAMPTRMGGMVVVLTDPSVLANTLIAGDRSRPEAQSQNFAFAYHLVSFLADNGTPHRRTQVWFIENGQERTDLNTVNFASGLPDATPSWEMIQSAIQKSLNDKVEDLQQRDWPHRSLMKSASWRQIMQKAAPAIALVALIYAFRKARAGRRDSVGVNTSFNFGPNAVPHGDAVQQLVEADEFREWVKPVIDDAMARWNATDGAFIEAVDQDVLKHTSADFKRLMSLRNAVPRKFGKSQWKKLVAMIEQMDADHRRGRWMMRESGGRA